MIRNDLKIKQRRLPFKPCGMKRRDSYSRPHLVRTQGFDDEDGDRLGDTQQRKGRMNSQQTRAHMRDIDNKEFPYKLAGCISTRSCAMNMQNNIIQHFRI